MIRKIFRKVPIPLLLLFIILSQINSKSLQSQTNDTIPEGIISFVTTRDGNFEIYTMTADGKNLTNLTKNNALDFWSSWSPDGKWIAYTSGIPAQYDVWIINVETKKKIRITTEPKRNETPVWKPNN